MERLSTKMDRLQRRFSLVDEINVGDCGNPLHAAARSARELPSTDWRTPDDDSDLLEIDCRAMTIDGAERYIHLPAIRTNVSSICQFRRFLLHFPTQPTMDL
jgi:hypothetical protein